MRAHVLVGVAGLAACGRFGFEAARTGGDASSDTGAMPIVDAPVTIADAPPDGPAAPCFGQFITPTYVDGLSVGLPGIAQAIKLTAPRALHVTRLEVFTGEKVGPSRLALASHVPSTDQPGPELGGAAFQIALPDGWQGVDLPAPVDLVPGQVAWLIWSTLDGAQATVESSMPPGAQEYKVTYDNSIWNGPYMLYGLKLKLWCDGAHP